MATDSARAGDRLEQPRLVGLRTALVSLATVLSLALGCGRPLPPLAPVSGMVTRAGKPITQGMVAFQPEKGRMGVGPIGNDGRFAITTFAAADGAIIGRHTVTIEAYTQGSGPQRPATGSATDDAEGVHASGPVVWLVPETYASLETTPLTAEVKPGTNTIDFQIP